GPRQRASQHSCAVRSGADTALRSRGFVSGDARLQTEPGDVRENRVQSCGGQPESAVLPGNGCEPSRAQSGDPTQRDGSNFERRLQRGPVPGDGRPLHADHRYAARTLSICRHSLVFDHVRPRRPDHRAGDADRDGFVEYYRATEQGLANQGWKDSYDAVFHANGRLAEGPIALAEVQGYVYAAKHLAAECARRLGNLDKAAALEAQAVRL